MASDRLDCVQSSIIDPSIILKVPPDSHHLAAADDDHQDRLVDSVTSLPQPVWPELLVLLNYPVRSIRPDLSLNTF